MKNKRKPDSVADRDSELLFPALGHVLPEAFTSKKGTRPERFASLDPHACAVIDAKASYELRRVFAGGALEIILTDELYYPDFPTFEAYLKARRLPNMSVVGKWRRAFEEWQALKAERLVPPHQVNQLLCLKKLPSLEMKKSALATFRSTAIEKREAKSTKRRAEARTDEGVIASSPPKEDSAESPPEALEIVDQNDETVTYLHLKSVVRAALESHTREERERILQRLVADLTAPMMSNPDGVGSPCPIPAVTQVATSAETPAVSPPLAPHLVLLIDETIKRLQLAPLIAKMDRTMMNKKPVKDVEVKTVISRTSGFAEKLLCTGPIANLGDGCAFKCSFCYVLMSFVALNARRNQKGPGPRVMEPGGAVLRRKDGVRVAILNLHDRHGNLHRETQQPHVLFTSTTVDPAANLELVRETAALCRVVLDLTVWEIRVLSKSALLPNLHELIPEQHRHRMIYGVSTGTVDDKLAAAFEQGTALVSKRIASIRLLQDLGARTFGMICPSLPVDDPDAFSAEICALLRVERMEHVWAEILNVRGESMKQTCMALDNAGFAAESAALRRVSNGGEEWEEYSRETFLAHTRHIPAAKLRFLQYVGSPAVASWWREQQANGAVLLGSNK